jgi:hypothetical protein
MPEWWNWQTRSTQNAMPSGVWVRIPPQVPLKNNVGLKLIFGDLRPGIGFFAFDLNSAQRLLRTQTVLTSYYSLEIQTIFSERV